MNALVELLRELVHAPGGDFARAVTLLSLIAIIAVCAAVLLT